MSAAGELTDFRNICFATHGITAEELKSIGFRQPALLLSCPDWQSAVETRDRVRLAASLLTAEDLSGCTLDAELVLLTACNTSAGDGEFGASAFSGLASALIRAGARSVLVSYWSASVAATQALPERLYDPTNRGVPRAKALRNAMLALRDDKGGRFARPGFGPRSR